MGAITHNGEVLQRLPADASQINFDNTNTDLSATQTENAIKEVNGKVNDNADEIDELKSGLTDLSGDFTTHHTTSLSGVIYYKCGILVFVTLSSVTLSNGTSLGVPGAGNNVVLTLRDESVGGISQVVMNTSGSITSGAGSTSFTDGHSYSGTVMYVSAQ